VAKNGEMKVKRTARREDRRLPSSYFGSKEAAKMLLIKTEELGRLASVQALGATEMAVGAICLLWATASAYLI
jgi:hypothetical protein